MCHIITIVRFLLEFGGVNMESQNNGGRTPLDIATERNFKDLEELFLLSRATLLYSIVRDNPISKLLQTTCYSMNDPCAFFCDCGVTNSCFHPGNHL